MHIGLHIVWVCMVPGKMSDGVLSFKEAGCFPSVSNTHSELGKEEYCIFKCICCTTAEFRVL